MFARKMIMVLLACGVVGGYSSGFRHMRQARQRHHDAMMHQMTSQCAEAAVRATQFSQAQQAQQQAGVSNVVIPGAAMPNGGPALVVNITR